MERMGIQCHFGKRRGCSVLVVAGFLLVAGIQVFRSSNKVASPQDTYILREVFKESRIIYQKIPSTNSLNFTELSTKAILADKPRGATNTLKSLSETRWKADNNWQREMEDMVEPKKKLSASKIKVLREYIVLSNKSHNFFSTSFEPPQLGSYRCRDSVCSEYLDRVDSYIFKMCSTKTRLGMLGTDINGPCRFMDGQGRASVGLVSFPGSGNTWLRAVLEAATGICTGSAYCDSTLRGHGFNGERVTSGAVLGVKTHYYRKVIWTDLDKPVLETMNREFKHLSKFTPPFGMVVLLIRNPYDAMVSEWNRRESKGQDTTNSHVGSSNQDRFGNFELWDNFVRSQLKVWKAYYNYILSAKKNSRPIHVVRYEDMKNDLVRETAKILDFLNMSVPDNDIERRLKADLGTFKRKHRDDKFQHFTISQKDLVNNTILSTLSYLQKKIRQTYSIEEYLDKT